MDSEAAYSSDVEMASQNKDFFASSPPDSKNIKSSPSAFSPLSSPPQNQKRDSTSPTPHHKTSSDKDGIIVKDHQVEYDSEGKGKENQERIKREREEESDEEDKKVSIEEEKKIKPKVRDGPLFLSDGNDIEVDNGSEFQEESEDEDVEPNLSKANKSRQPPSKRFRTSSSYSSDSKPQNQASQHSDSNARFELNEDQEDPELDPWEQRFLGSFVIEAYSASKKLKSGHHVKIQHNKPQEIPVKNIPGNFFSKKKTKKVVEDIVRMTKDGFEVGRTSIKDGKWITKLLDYELAELTGIVVDCELGSPFLTPIIVEVKAYLKRDPFRRSLTADGFQDVSHLGFRAGAVESEAEKMLKGRKASMLKLLRLCSVKPVVSNAAVEAHKAQDEIKAEDVMDHFSEEVINTTREISSRVASGSKPRSPPSNSLGSDSSQPIEIDGDEEEDVKSKITAEELEVPDDNEGPDIKEDQLAEVYSKTSHLLSLPEIDPPETFNMNLRTYQKQALGWMLEQEKTKAQKEEEELAEEHLHPLWEKYTFAPDLTDPSSLTELADARSRDFYFNPYTGDLSLKFQPASRGSRGGILADEMGLGKTIMIASLIHTNRPEEDGPSQESSEDEEDTKPNRSQLKKGTLEFVGKKKNYSKQSPSNQSTLVVAPMSLVAQWRDELLRASKKNTLSVQLYYGNASGKGEVMDLVENGEVDVVVTSYGTLVSEYKTYKKNGFKGLYGTNWFRVILDEAHQIRSRNTQSAKAAFDLEARRRWCLTGSPIINRCVDLFSLLHFLKVEPWGDFGFFNTFIAAPFAEKNPKALQIIQVVLESVLLRREKKMKDRNGDPIVPLPPKTYDIRHLEFSPVEREIYDAIYFIAKTQYERLRNNGTVGKNIGAVFAILMRLRQAVCHPLLLLKITQAAVDAEKSLKLGETSSNLRIKKLITQFHNGGGGSDSDDEGNGTSNVDAVAQLQKLLKEREADDPSSSQDNACPLCFEEDKAEECYMACGHSCCKLCIIEYLQTCENEDKEATCPTCREGPVYEQDLVEKVKTRQRKNKFAAVINGEGEEESNEIPLSQGSTGSQPAEFFQRNDFRSSTKLEALVSDLNQLRYDEPGFKGVIFSQFTSFLDLVEVVLTRNKHSFVRLDGTISQKNREQVLNQFKSSSGSMVILISLKAGGVGLNLTAANHVWLLDAWWAAAIEEQAVDRVHRLGATKPVTVHRYLISDSIEDRIMQIQKRKTALVQGALSGSGNDSNAVQNLNILFS